MGQGCVSVDTLLPGRAAMVRQGGGWHSGHTKPRGTDKCQSVTRVGTGGILGAGGMNGHGASLPPLVLPTAVLQSVLCGADALTPVRTGAAGSASLTLLGNGSLIYQVRVRGCRR